jgi:UDP-N-acetylmuramoyl-L-alanyl-D-glutamate--2,6-diaminopimelate ligase
LRLIELLGRGALEAHRALESAAREVRGITANWEAVEPGWVFVSLAGREEDGRTHVGEALRRGAVAVVGPTGIAAGAGAATAPLIVDQNPRRAFALLAARFHGRQPRVVVAVTGTDGKTSVVELTAQLWRLLGRRAASLGTLGLRPPGRQLPDRLTTPFPMTLHSCLASLAVAGFDRLALEATSIGLDEHRVDGVELAAAAFTNLSHEHLGYHGSLSAYRAAKRRLFASILAPGGSAVLNADSAELDDLASLCRARRHDVWTYGRRGTEIRLEHLEPMEDSQRLTVDLLGRRWQVTLPLIGDFQALNALCALGLVVASGEDAGSALSAVAELRPVPGRLERVARHPGGAPIYVDYAHTPNGLRTVLEAVRPFVPQRLVLVFGCGGESDHGKRRRMGEIAGRLADRVIVTDDNPRSEEPRAIRSEIVSGCPGAVEIDDRANAIEAGVRQLGSGDVMIVAGKGHESVQLTAEGARPFDDGAVTRAAAVAVGGEPEP